MFNTKAVLAAAALAMAAMAWTAPAANADPYGRHLNRVENRLEHRDARIHNRIVRVDHRIARHDRVQYRRPVERTRVEYILRARHYRMVGNPYYLGPRYVVHTYNRFGRGVLVQINPWTGAFMGVIRM